MSLYSDEIRRIANSYTWPPGLIVDIVEHEDNLGVRIYRDNFERLDGVDKLHYAHQIGDMVFAIRQKGCPCYTEAAKGDGRVERA